jgi:hypothetical protein
MSSYRHLKTISKLPSDSRRAIYPICFVPRFFTQHFSTTPPNTGYPSNKRKTWERKLGSKHNSQRIPLRLTTSPKEPGSRTTHGYGVMGTIKDEPAVGASENLLVKDERPYHVKLETSGGENMPGSISTPFELGGDLTDILKE